MTSKELRALLQSQAHARQPIRRSTEFWCDFRLRAKPLRQMEGAEALASLSLPAFRWVSWKAGPLLAAAAASLIAMLWIGSASDPRGPGAVRSYRIGEDMAHGGVMILDDAPSHATILWIVDCAENGAPVERGPSSEKSL